MHLYACRWDEQALPGEIRFHPLPLPRGPRFRRPWRFARLCENALQGADHDVSVGFDKTWGQDILYPQGGLHVASREPVAVAQERCELFEHALSARDVLGWALDDEHRKALFWASAFPRGYPYDFIEYANHS